MIIDIEFFNILHRHVHLLYENDIIYVLYLCDNINIYKNLSFIVQISVVHEQLFWKLGIMPFS